jgi:hypothetical protein
VADAPVTETPPAAQQYQMSDRARRRFLIGLFAGIVILFVAGMVMFLVDFRHRTVCEGGAQWISRTDDGIGKVTYTCPDGKTVTQGILP